MDVVGDVEMLAERLQVLRSEERGREKRKGRKRKRKIGLFSAMIEMIYFGRLWRRGYNMLCFLNKFRVIFLVLSED